MKRQIALLFALTFMVSGMATIAEEAATDVETAETKIVETAENEELEWTAPFEDGEWMSIPEWNAELYLPTGWLLSEVTETGFIASDMEATSTLTVTMEDFVTEDTAEAEATAEAEETTETVETEATTDADTVEPSIFETYLMEQDLEYELSMAGEREMAVMTSEESVTVKFLLNDKLVTMDFTPAAEGGIADSALSIAETFYIYDEVEPVEVEAAGETGEAAAE